MTLYFITPRTEPRAIAIGYKPSDPPPCCILADWIRESKVAMKAGELRQALGTGKDTPFGDGVLRWMEA